MANIKSNKKHLRKSLKRSIANRAVLSRMRTQFKKISNKLSENKLDSIEKELSVFYKYTDKATKKGVIKKNKAARKKSEISKKISALTLKK